MIRLGLGLTLTGGREAITRLMMIACAVAVGVCLLLATFAAVNAVKTQNLRYAWLETGYAGAKAGPTVSAADADTLWWLESADYYQGRKIGRVDVAPTGPHSPVPPGIPTLPLVDQFYASPALIDLLAHVPAEQLGDRYPGRLIGTIGPAALPSPDSLVVIVGRTAADLSGTAANRSTASAEPVRVSAEGTADHSVSTPMG